MAEAVNQIVTLAANGTANTIIQIPLATQQMSIRVNAQYAAVSATASGVKATFQTSIDGTTFVSAQEPAVVAAGPANTVLETGQLFNIGSNPFRLDNGSPAAIKVSLQNLDGSNAATAVVRSLPKFFA